MDTGRRMNVFGFLNPEPTISERDIESGLHWMTWDGAVSNGFSSITTSGILADFFSHRQLMLVFHWFDEAQRLELPAFSVASYDSLFAITFTLGLLTLSILSLVHEEGEVGREVALESLTSPMREFSQKSVRWRASVC